VPVAETRQKGHLEGDFHRMEVWIVACFRAFSDAKRRSVNAGDLASWSTG